jgi:CheY-like chemotaxis protein
MFTAPNPVQEFLKDSSSIAQVMPAKVNAILGVQVMAQAGEKRSVTVLIVDDSDDLRDLMVFQIQSLGYETVEATNGLEAIEVARQTSPSLILMDINMPLLDGLAATRVIRESEQFSSTPIVAFSAYLGGVHRALALEAGCNEFVSKTECVDKLENILGRFAPLV